jgi:hypothetical protein
MKTTHHAFCLTCRKKHRIAAVSAAHFLDAYSDWLEKHPRSRGCLPGLKSLGPDGIEAFGDNADVKEAFQAEQTMTVTNLHSLATSTTAGWTSASVDNSSNLYLDALVSVHVAAVNTAPANSKALFLYAYGSTDGSIFTSTGTSGGTVGTEGALTFPDVTTLPVVMPLLGVIPYPVQNKALDAGPFSVARAFGGVLPRAWGVAIINHTGMTLAASANTVKQQGTYNTVI